MPVEVRPKIKTINCVQKNRLIITQIQKKSENDSNENLENPFESAAKEIAKLEAHQDEKRRRMKLFELKLKKRLKEYKSLNDQLDEDCQLKIDKSHKKVSLVKKKLTNSSSNKSIETSKLEQRFQRSLSVSSLPACLMRTLKDEKANDNKSELKKRIISTRKIYSNNEREQVRRNQQLQEQQIKQKESSKKEEIPKKNEPELDMKPAMETSRSITSVSTQQSSQMPAHNMDRYIGYLKQLLKDKAKQFKLDVPPLCQCNMFEGNSINLWDNDWNNCANNCLFYKNPKEYARVLINMVNN